MNWQHLQAFLWLHWRLLVNQWRRGGAINGILMIVVAWCALILVAPLFIGALVLGIFALPDAEPVHLLYTWDGLLLVFLFFWSIGLVTDLQRTETLSLGKFLHLPVSIKEAFLINYLSSLLRLSLIVFVPLMLGLALAMVIVQGPLLLCVLPLLLAFLLMVTALTCQFQGWLASLMSNPRRRRTVVVATTALFVLTFQLPNLLNVAAPWRVQADQSNILVQDLAALNQRFQAGEFDAQEHLRRQQELLQNHQAATEQVSRANAQQWEQTARWINLLLPIGWLPLGVRAATEGSLVPALLGGLGMTLLGAGSLWRAYRTTLQLYQGQFTAKSSRPEKLAGNDPPVRATATRTIKPSVLLVEVRLPGLSESVAAIALGGFRSLARAPEAKMMLMTPILLAGVFGWGALRHAHEIPLTARPFIAIVAMALVHFGAATDGQSIRLRPRWLSRVCALCGSAAGHPVGQEPGLRPAGSGNGNHHAGRRAGHVPHALGPFPGHAAAVHLDVSPVLPAGQSALHLCTDAHRRGLDEAGESQTGANSAANEHVYVPVPADSGAGACAAVGRAGFGVAWLDGRRADLPAPVAVGMCGRDLYLPHSFELGRKSVAKPGAAHPGNRHQPRVTRIQVQCGDE